MSVGQSKIGGKVRDKIVLNTPYNIRKVFYNKETGQQVAVANMYVHEPEEEHPQLVEWSDIMVSIPVESMAGWHVEVRGLADARKVASRECTSIGRIYNRFILIPWAFLNGKLS